MYLFTRRVRLGGKVSDSISWAGAITEGVNKASGLEIGLWAPAYSPGVGTAVWAAFVPDLPTLEGAMDRIAGDSACVDLIDRGTDFVIPGSADDSLGMILHGEPDPDREVTYVAVVSSTMAAGALGRGVALGIEIAQAAEAITGLPTSFLVEVTGNYGGVSWITAFADAAEMERAEMTLNGDQSFVELIDKNSGVYTDHPGATTQAIFRRIV